MVKNMVFLWLKSAPQKQYDFKYGFDMISKCFQKKDMILIWFLIACQELLWNLEKNWFAKCFTKEMWNIILPEALFKQKAHIFCHFFQPKNILYKTLP